MHPVVMFTSLGLSGPQSIKTVPPTVQCIKLQEARNTFRRPCGPSPHFTSGHNCSLLLSVLIPTIKPWPSPTTLHTPGFLLCSPWLTSLHASYHCCLLQGSVLTPSSPSSPSSPIMPPNTGYNFPDCGNTPWAPQSTMAQGV